MNTLKNRALLAAIVLVTAAALAFLLSPWGELGAPSIQLHGDVSSIGTQKELEIKVADKNSGLSFVDIAIIQAGKKHSLFLRDFEEEKRTTATIPLLVEAAELGLVEGNATLKVLVRDRSLWKNKALFIKEIQVDLTPPQLSLLSGSPNYIRPGGSAVVTYSSSKPLSSSWISIGNSTYRGFATANENNNTFVAFFTLPIDNTGRVKASVIAEDASGNKAEINIPLQVIRKNLRHDRVAVEEEVFDKIRILERYYPQLSGLSDEEAFKLVNKEIRLQSDARVKNICSVSSLQSLWKGTFLRMQGATTKANFADQRTYTSKGALLGNSSHLGIDLASTANAPVEAANTGVIIFCGDLGIYGNTVIIDHGQGLFSLYAHLSRIDVKENDFVKRGDFIGKSGSTGLAVGDHLHFSIMIFGDFVDPQEWWDSNWVNNNIISKLH